MKKSTSFVRFVLPVLLVASLSLINAGTALAVTSTTNITTNAVADLTPDSATQGATNVPIMTFSVTTGAAAGEKLKEIKLRYTGTDTDDVDNVYVYRESGTVPGTFDVTDTLFDSNASASSETTLNPSDLALSASTAYQFYVVVDIDSSATISNSIDFKVETDKITFDSGTWPSAADITANGWNPAGSTTIISSITTDEVAQVGPTNTLQGALKVPILSFTLSNTDTNEKFGKIITHYTGTNKADITKVYLYQESGTLAGSSFDSVSDGPFLNSSTSINGSNETTLDPTNFNFTQTKFYIVVDVKATATLGNTIDFDVTANKITFTGSHTWPPTSEVTAGTWNPSGDTIISLPTATLTVIKHVITDNGGTAVAGDWNLTVSSSNGGTGTGSAAGSESGTLYTIDAGKDYSVAESGGPTEYSESDSTDCNITNATTDASYTCTITNDDQPGTLTIVKNTVGGNGTFIFTVSGPTPSTPDITTSGLTGTTGALEVNAGSYSVTEEEAGSSWDFTSASCDNGSPSGSTVSGIDVPLGADVTCTFTNTKRGSITVIKNVVAPNGETYVDDSKEFDVTLNGGNQKTISEGASKTYSDLVPGEPYTIAEIGDPDFDLLRITVGDVDDATPEDGADVTVVAGQDTEVTITNGQKQGHLIVKKIVTNPNGGEAVAGDFSFSLNDEDDIEFNQDGENELRGENDLEVDPGTYTITETPPDGAYAISYDNCEITIESNGQPSEATTCTITNSDIPEEQGAITVRKILPNNNGGTAVVSDFLLKVTSVPGEGDPVETPMTSGESGFFNPGNYVVSESNPSVLYTQSISCTDGEIITEDGNITLSAQQSWTCTITNDDIAPVLTLVKQVVKDNGGTAEPTDWTLSADADGPTPVSGISGSEDVTNAEVNAGIYTLSESDGPDGYTASETWSCVVNGSEPILVNSVELGLGDVATCTITNDDNRAKLTIVKNTDEASGDGDFNFTVTGTGENEFSEQVELSTEDGSAETEEPIELDAGSYDVVESVPEGWSFSSAICEYDEEDNFGEDIQNGENITFGSGDEVTCTFTNTKRATLTVKKIVINDDGGTKTASDFSFQVGDGDAISFDAGENNLLGENPLVVNAGTYSVTEPAVEGYTTTYENCSEIILANGGSAICTITNNDVQSSSGNSSGSRARPKNPNPEGEVLGAETGPNSPKEGEGEVQGDEKFVFTLFLKKGPPYPESKKNEVMELQKFLNVAGFGPLVVDGKFGPLTEIAVIKFQLANGLKGDGVIGPLTRAVLNKPQ